MSEGYASGCELFSVEDPAPNTQLFWKVDLIETTFLGILAGECRNDYVAIHDGRFAPDSLCVARLPVPVSDRPNKKQCSRQLQYEVPCW